MDIAVTRDRVSDIWTLGINVGHHDAAAALLRGGEIVALVEQERLSRVKRALNESPCDAIAEVLRLGAISLSDVSIAAIGTDVELLRGWQGLQRHERPTPEIDDPDRLFPRDRFGPHRPDMVSVNHHLAHAASAFYPSGLDRAAVLVIDNRGEDASTSICSADTTGITILKQYPISASLGLFYRSAAEYAGLYGRHGQVGKLMGLAPYGRWAADVGLTWTAEGPNLGVVEPRSRGVEMPNLLRRTLLDKFEATCYPYASSVGDIMAYAPFARGVQESLERVILHLAMEAKTLTGMSDLVIAGGVGLNCSANGTLSCAGLFNDIFVQPASHDAGVALGAALVAASDRGLRPNARMEHSYWGASFSDSALAEALRANGLAFSEASSISDEVAKDLASSKLVAWFQGRAEWGPRALGARSILANPGMRTSHVRLNSAKRREMWRPLAPSVTTRKYDDMFVGRASPFMLVASSIRPHVIPTIPAVAHTDGTARPQAVDPSINPLFHDVLVRFGDLEGVEAVVNTSFNDESEPIVYSPTDAIRSFLRMPEVETLALGPFIARR